MNRVPTTFYETLYTTDTEAESECREGCMKVLYAGWERPLAGEPFMVYIRENVERICAPYVAAKAARIRAENLAEMDREAEELAECERTIAELPGNARLVYDRRNSASWVLQVCGKEAFRSSTVAALTRTARELVAGRAQLPARHAEDDRIPLP